MMPKATVSITNTNTNQQNTPMLSGMSEKIAHDIMLEFNKVIASDKQLQTKVEKFRDQLFSCLADNTEIFEPENPCHSIGLRNRKDPAKNRKKEMSISNDDQTDKIQRTQKIKDACQEPSFIKHMIGTLLPHFLGWPGVALGVVANAGAAAAQSIPADLVINSGSAGTTNLCDGLHWCIQEIVKNITSDAVVATATRDFSIADNSGSATTELALQGCFTPGKLKGVVEQVISTPNWQGDASCAATSNIWWGTVMTGAAQGVSPQGCTQFQNSFENAAASCQTSATGAASFGIALGFFLAATCVGAICLGGWFCLKDTNCQLSSLKDCQLALCGNCQLPSCNNCRLPSLNSQLPALNCPPLASLGNCPRPMWLWDRVAQERAQKQKAEQERIATVLASSTSTPLQKAESILLDSSLTNAEKNLRLSELYGLYGENESANVQPSTLMGLAAI